MEIRGREFKVFCVPLDALVLRQPTRVIEDVIALTIECLEFGFSISRDVERRRNLLIGHTSEPTDTPTLQDALRQNVVIQLERLMDRGPVPQMLWITRHIASGM